MKENTNTTTMPIVTKTASLYEDKTAAEVVSILNQTEDKNLHAPIIAAIEEKLKEENKEAVKIDVETFAHCYKTDEALFWKNMIELPYATIHRLVEDENDGYILKPSKRRILFSQVDSVYQQENSGKSIAAGKNYVRMIARITDNLYKSKCADLSAEAGKDCAVVRVMSNIDGETVMREVDFSKSSIGGIKDQIQALVDTILPENERVKICSADVRYIQTVTASGNESKVKTANEKNVEKAIFDAIKTRRLGVAYEVESRAKCHKAEKKEVKKSERTEKQEEVMSKVPDRPEAAATLSKKETAETVEATAA